MLISFLIVVQLGLVSRQPSFIRLWEATLRKKDLKMHFVLSILDLMVVKGQVGVHLPDKIKTNWDPFFGLEKRLQLGSHQLGNCDFALPSFNLKYLFCFVLFCFKIISFYEIIWSNPDSSGRIFEAKQRGNEREKSHHLLVLKEVVLRPIFQKGEEAITHFTFLSVFQDFCLPFVITKLWWTRKDFIPRWH